jgi:transmembrane sensor
MGDIDWDLLFRYRGNECTPEERERFERWLAADPKHRAILEAAVVAAGRVLETRVVRPFPARAGTPRSLPWGTVPRRQRAPRHVWAIAIAASVVVAALGGGLIWRALESSPPEAAVRVATTGRGERATLRLHDGTRVVLGAASTLRYPADFAGQAAREVVLTGEAYFDVVHDARHPFRVRAGDAVAEDLGTAFSVRAYAEDSAVRVVVAHGKVALGAATSGAVRGAVLTPGQLGRLAKGDASTAVENVDVAAYLGWTDGRLAFEETPLPEALAQLARWYDADFRLADPSLAAHRITATFGEESLGEVLAVLGPATGLRFERRGRTIVVLPPAGRR